MTKISRMMGLALALTGACAVDPLSPDALGGPVATSESDLACSEASLSACERAQGTTRTVHASATSASAPSVRSDGSVYGLRLAPLSESPTTEYAGHVSFTATRTGVHHLYVGAPSLGVAVTDAATGGAVAEEFTEDVGCSNLRRVRGFTLMRGRRYDLSFGPTTVSWTRLYVEGAVASCTAPSPYVSAACDDAVDTLNAASAAGPLAPNQVYNLKLNAADGSGEVTFTPDMTADYQLLLGTPYVSYELSDADGQCANIPECRASTSGAACTSFKAAYSYALKAGVPYTLRVLPGPQRWLRAAFFRAPSACEVDNGGCDPLTACAPSAEGGRTCGACPDGYDGDGVSGCVVEPPPPELQISLGNGHGCAVDDDGRMKCWGSNSYAQLGLGDRAHRGDGPSEMGDNLPFVDTGVPVRSVTAGSGETCIIGTDDSVRCWGSDYRGQAGQITGAARYIGDVAGEMGAALARVDLGTGVVAARVEAFVRGFCALTTDGRVKCWGTNDLGQLGTGDLVSRPAPRAGEGDAHPFVDLGAGFVVSDLACSDASCCALSTDNSVKCWGYAAYGAQCGVSSSSPAIVGDVAGELGDALAPIDLGTSLVVRDLVASGAGYCVQFTDGRAKCWGLAGDGATGLGVEDFVGPCGDALPFLNLGTGVTIDSIPSPGTGSSTMCAVVNGGQLKCWGNQTSGSLGWNATSPRGDGPNEMGNNLPFIDLGAGRRVTTLWAGRFHKCARLDDGALKCWGSNSNGALGQGNTGFYGFEGLAPIPGFDLGI